MMEIPTSVKAAYFQAGCPPSAGDRMEVETESRRAGFAAASPRLNGGCLTSRQVMDNELRQHLVQLLKGQGAHMDLEAAISEFPSSIGSSGVPGVSHTPWRLLEHMRIAQSDILEFCRNPEHVSPEFPAGYWPGEGMVGGETDWSRTASSFLEDLKAMQEYVLDPGTDLFVQIPHGDGQTVLREALVVADHNSYHLGQIMVIRRACESLARS